VSHSKAIVTIAIGEKYYGVWKRVCEANWQAYADKYAYDLICIDRPLDTSERAAKRSPAWQKCLILSQDFSANYERVVWIDSDILINTAAARCIAADVPVSKVGAVEAMSQPTHALYVQALGRLYEFWRATSLINFEPHQYYTNWGLPSGFNEVVQTGVLVLSPSHHRKLLEKTYFDYEEKGGREWHMEMRPLSYELMKADVVHWLDHRFNLNWGEQRAMYYPFLLESERRLGLASRVWRKALDVVGGRSNLRLVALCATTAFLNSYMLHFGGSDLSDMDLVDLTARSWRDLGMWK